ncbi:hypothetical protein BC834DRAFT_644907 [Gloeopeniophorella convolvens]|nr:hypothetical protein BC834DRAFT_644907 [Gloeopeniophorella convolvens]
MPLRRSGSSQMSVLRDTKLTDFFPRRPSFGATDPPSSQPSIPGRSQSDSTNSKPLPPRPVVKRKPGGPKGSGKKVQTSPDQNAGVSLKRPSYVATGGVSAPQPPLPGSSQPDTDNSSPPMKRKPGRPKGSGKKAVKPEKDASSSRSSTKATPLDLSVAPSPLHANIRSRLRASSPKKAPITSRVVTPSKRKLDDDDAASITSSEVPLSLFYTPNQGSTPSNVLASRPSKSSLYEVQPSSARRVSSKRRRISSPKKPSSVQVPATPVKVRTDEEVVPTSQSSEIGLYTPVRTNTAARRKQEVQDGVESWRRGKSAYKLGDTSPLRLVSDGDYSMEVDRPLSPLTSCQYSTAPESPLSSVPDLDVEPLPAVLDELPPPLSQHSLPSPSSSSGGEALPIVPQLSIPPPVRPVTPPPSSPEQEQHTPTPVAPKDSKTKTAEIIAEILANVRAKAVADDDDDDEARLHAPIKDELSSDEDEDEPFWKTAKPSTSRLPQASVTPGAAQSRTRGRSSLPSPSSPSPSHRSTSPDEPLSTQYNARGRRSQAGPVFDPSSPFNDAPVRRPMRKKRPTTREVRTLTVAPVTIPAARKVDPIGALLRERKKETRTGGGIDALNLAEGYDPDNLLSDFSIDEEDEGSIPDAPSDWSGWADEDTAGRAVSVGLQNDRASVKANPLEDEVLQEDRERLLGAKEGEAVGKILDADRKLGQVIAERVHGVRVFAVVADDEEDAEMHEEALDIHELTKDTTAALHMLCEAVKRQDGGYTQVVLRILSAKDLAVPGVAQWLCEQALWSEDELLGRVIRRFLLDLPLWAQSYLGSPLSVDLIAHTFSRLGIREDLRAYVHTQQGSTLPRLPNRSGVLRNMVRMIATFSSRWSAEQLPDVIMSLLLIGVDAGSSAELRRDVLSTLSLLCWQLPADFNDAENNETLVAERVLDFAKTLSAPNQAFLLSFFTKGSEPSLRIARAVAHHILTNSVIEASSYALPPLDPLIAVLAEPDGPFDIADATDYDSLTSRVAILSVVLSDIESYVEEESSLRRLAQVTTTDGSPRKKEMMPLELVRARLDAMHGKIFDTRAAHLDRSRAKGAIQRLSMRVHYQRAALSKTSCQMRLGAYFTPGDTFRQPKQKNRW